MLPLCSFLKINLQQSNERKELNLNDIISLLNLEDSDIEIESIKEEGRTKIVTLFTRPQTRFCPKCGYLMHSRGIKLRTVNHPILQDTFNLKIHLKQRRWRCTNQDCKYDEAEQFNFVDKNCRNTRATDLLIVNEFRNLNRTATDIAEKFNTSDTYVTDVFNRFVNMERLPLGEAISIDEVYLDMADDCKYALVIQDFITGEAIDIVVSRKQNVTQPYFLGIPFEERSKVKYLISDMYNEYIRYVDNYFPNALSIVDSFHVVQWLRSELEQYIRDLQKEYERRDEEKQKRMPYDGQGRQRRIPMSDEVYLLKNYRFFLLANDDDIITYEESHMDRHFRYYMNTVEYRHRFFEINPRLIKLRIFRNKYVEFNKRNAGKPQKAALELEALIEEYRNSDDEIFERFARLLKRYKQPIINSFILLERIGSNGDTVVSRLSNGPMEAMNRLIKDLRREAHGFRNFENLRNRFLFASRNNPVLNGKVHQKDSTEKKLRFKNTVTREQQRKLLGELQLINEKYPDMTTDETLALKHWISDGNSPFKNPDIICDEYGVITDFITASRILDEAFSEGEI